MVRGKPVIAPTRKHPNWIRAPLYPCNKTYWETRELLRRKRIRTVCREALCPNMGGCFSGGIVTALIMGEQCTRSCMFCGVTSGPVEPLDKNEPKRVAEVVRELKLRYIVITSVTRDDLTDGGAGHYAETVREIKKLVPSCSIEVLIPDFLGDLKAVDTVIESRPDLIAHNVETIPALYNKVRPEADYGRSLKLLTHVKQVTTHLPVKSGLMLGLGETRLEMLEVMKDLVKTGCDALTLGQYLQPTRNHVPVIRYLHPAEFAEIKYEAQRLGFSSVASAPLVRSSYFAENILKEVVDSKH